MIDRKKLKKGDKIIGSNRDDERIEGIYHGYSPSEGYLMTRTDGAGWIWTNRRRFTDMKVKVGTICYHGLQ